MDGSASSIELFAGAGGLAIGTAMAGFNHRVVIEWDKNACRTLRTNADSSHGHGGDWNVYEGDVRAFDFKEHRGLDLISGGPPCQPFSMGGKHLGKEDERNMFPEAVRAVREAQPRAFIFENVKGLLRSGFANYYNYILQQLRYPNVRRRGDEEWTDHHKRLDELHTSGKYRGLSYYVVPKLMNAADYGVPQVRQRVLIVGIRSDLGVEFSHPDPTHGEDALLYSKWVSGEYWDSHQVPKSKRPDCPERLRRRVESLRPLMPNMLPLPWKTVRDAISDLPRIGAGQTSSKVANHFLNPGARAYFGHDGSPWDEPAKTLKAGDHGVPGGENTLRLDDGSVRYFSVRECARLQTFPDKWIFEGSWTESMRQLGNAVPVLLAQAVATSLAATLAKAAQSAERSRAPWTTSLRKNAVG